VFDLEVHRESQPARYLYTATLLPKGMVLAAGGHVSYPYVSASAEMYDSASDTWTPTGSLNTERAEHTATLLPNGMVLVAGGSAEFDGSNVASLGGTIQVSPPE
jgi:glycine/serine hydroxymethyltransferase